MRADAREAIDHRAAAVKTVTARYFFSVFSVCSVVGHIPDSELRTTEYTDYTEGKNDSLVKKNRTQKPGFWIGCDVGFTRSAAGRFKTGGLQQNREGGKPPSPDLAH